MNTSDHSHFLNASMIHDAACQIANGTAMKDIADNVLGALSERVLAELNSRSRREPDVTVMEQEPF